MLKLTAPSEHNNQYLYTNVLVVKRRCFGRIRQACGSTLQARIQLYSTGMWVNLTGENTAVFNRHVGRPYRREYSCIQST